MVNHSQQEKSDWGWNYVPKLYVGFASLKDRKKILKYIEHIFETLKPPLKSHLTMMFSYVQDGFWADHSCEKKIGYICKRKPLSEAPTEEETIDTGCQRVSEEKLLKLTRLLGRIKKMTPGWIWKETGKKEKWFLCCHH